LEIKKNLKGLITAANNEINLITLLANRQLKHKTAHFSDKNT